jgi:ankyrin repeat protein
MENDRTPVAAFIEAASVPQDTLHVSGTLDRAEEILRSNPSIATADIFTAAILGDHQTVRRLVDSDKPLATTKGGPRDWDPLTYLCFSRYLRIDESRSDDFVKAATILLDAGANPNSGWFEPDHQPKPEWESVIYGAAGLAHNAGLTQLLLERGADPNDEETPYHAPESYDNRALKVLVQSGKLTRDNLATILLRKADWHDYEGIKWLLEQGVEPDTITRWGKTALQQAVLRDNIIDTIRILLDHGSDPTLIIANPQRPDIMSPGSVVETAAVRGRGDVLQLFRERGIDTDLQGVYGLLAACAVNDAARISEVVKNNPQLVAALKATGAMFLCNFAGNGNTDGVRNLLDLGVPVNAVSLHGDPYFGVARNSTALHVAAWRARHDTVQLLIDRGAKLDARDAEGRTPLQLAVKACVDSYWMNRRSPESIKMLVNAGASREGIRLPTGYDAADAVLAANKSI